MSNYYGMREERPVTSLSMNLDNHARQGIPINY